MSLISMHTYWIINLSIAISYIITKTLLKLPMMNKKLTQSSQLTFARKSLLMILLTFVVLPVILTSLPIQQMSYFEIKPIAMQASSNFFQDHVALKNKISMLQTSQTFPMMHSILTLAIITGLVLVLAKYIKNILILKELTVAAYCHRKIKHTRILFSDITHIPFCWSWFQSHFVIIPSAYIQKEADLKLAIHHELQHIRQGDTYWLHFLSILKVICFWNPFIKYWMNWFNELQEFACDESIVVKNKASSVVYAQCLIDTAATIIHSSRVPQGALGILGLSANATSTLNKRVTRLFDYKRMRARKISLMCGYALCFLAASTIAFAITDHPMNQAITANYLASMTQQSALSPPITPEVIAEINDIRGSEQARSFMTKSLDRMQQYKGYITEQLSSNAMPTNLLALPLAESGYNVDAVGPLATTGIWQFIPATAKQFHLSIVSTRDDRLDTKLSTGAAIDYLQSLHTRFKDWHLAVIAYEIGEVNTVKLIHQVGSRDAWTLARSPYAPHDLKRFLALFDASVLIIQHPELVTKAGS